IVRMATMRAIITPSLIVAPVLRALGPGRCAFAADLDRDRPAFAGAMRRIVAEMGRRDTRAAIILPGLVSIATTAVLRTTFAAAASGALAFAALIAVAATLTATSGIGALHGLRHRLLRGHGQAPRLDDEVIG